MPRIQPAPTLSAQLIASKVGGQVRGDEAREVSGIAPLESSEPSSLSFSRQTTKSLLAAELGRSRAGVVLVAASAAGELGFEHLTLVLVPDPLASFCELVPNFFRTDVPSAGVHPKAEVHPSVKLGAGVSVGAFCVVGEGCVIGDGAVLHPHVVLYSNVKIGKGAVLHAHAVIREECEIGDQCVVQNGAVVGADGFGYHFVPSKGLIPVPQVGTVTLAPRVDIGANTCVDRATMGTTSIGLGTKLDNLVQVGHNVKIGAHSVLCGAVALAGTTEVGSGVTLAGQVGVAGHLKIGDRVRVGAKAGVTNTLEEPGDYAGFPAVPVRDWRREVAMLRRLPAILKKLRLNRDEE